MSGIDWQALGKATFEDITDILLGREYGTRGHAVNGRGGDDGIDYDVDDSKIIFQYKYFPDGFPTSGTRRSQIRDSFNKAMKHDPDEWILVVPAAVTPKERLFVTGLGKGKRVKISIRDKTWLNNALIENRDIAEHYRFSSDVDYLYAKGERFKHNPIVRDTTDIAERLGGLNDAIDTADPNWTVDFHSVGGTVTQVLRAKDANAAERSPITISFTAELTSDSPEARDLQTAEAFGYTKPIILPGEMIKDFKVDGPRILGAEDRDIQQLEFHPIIEDAGWKPTELLLADADGEQLGLYLAEGQLTGQGRDGFTLQVRLGRYLDLTFRCPLEPVAGSVDFKSHEFSGDLVPNVFEVADFIVQAAAATTLEIRAGRERVVLMDIAGKMAGSDIADGFDDIRDIAEDLKIIESGTRAKFRFPGQLHVVDRILIRALRLMLEGHVVAHPLHTRLSGQLNGTWDEKLEEVLTADYHWAVLVREPDELVILEQSVRLPKLSRAARVRLDEKQIEEIRSAFAAGTAEGRPFHLDTAPGDRIRMFLPDRVPADGTLEITPWNLPGVTQQGLDSEGGRFPPEF